MTQKLVSRLHDTIQKILRFVEKDRTNVVIAFLLVTLYAFFRVFFEKILLIEGNVIPETGQICLGPISHWAHVIAFFIAAFLGGTLVISVLSKQSVRRVVNVMLCGFWMIILSPLMDRYIFGITDITRYEYFLTTNILRNLSPFSFFSNAPPGISMQLLGILFLASLYVFFRSKSVLRTLLTAFVIYLFMIGLFSLFFTPIVESFSDNAIQILYFEMFFFISILLVAILVDISNKKILPNMLINLRPYRTMHFALMAFIGIIIANNLKFMYDFPFVLLTLLLPAFLYQCAGIINDVYDIEIDKTARKKSALIRGVLTRSQYLNLGILVAIISFAISILLGLIPMLLTLGFILFGYMYSAPPLRLRNSLFSSSIIGLWSVFAFFIGYFATKEVGDVFLGNYLLLVPVSTTTLTTNAIFVALVIFFALSMGPILTDLKDYEGDKKDGVKSIYTVFGLERGKKIATALIPIMFLIPLLILHGVLDIIVFIPLGIIAAIDFKKFGRVQHVFIYYFIVLAYCIVRAVGIV